MNWGIGYQDFLTSEGRAMFQHLLGYFQMPETAGAVIGPYALQQMYPTFHLYEDSSMTTESLCVEVRRNRMRSELEELLVNSSELVKNDPQVALNKLNAGISYLQNIGMARRTDVYAADAMGRIMQRYEQVERGVNLSVCSWPWEPLQEATGGIEKDDFIVLYGRPKSMKSWVLAALIAWCWEQGKSILIYTKEMTADNIFMRVGAILAGVRYHEFRRGKLSFEEKNAIHLVWRMIAKTQMTQPMVCLSGKDAGEGGDTVPWLRSKIEQHKPGIVFIDGLYLMSDLRGSPKQKDNFRVQNISRDTRRMVLETGIPVICTLQANRAAAKNEEANLDEIAFSDAVGQDATLAMRVINEKNKPTIALLVGGSREFHLEGLRIFGMPAVNFDYFGPLTTIEAQRAVAADVSESEQDKKSKPPKAAKAGDGSTEESWAKRRQRAPQ